jgi:hypothetical protein
VNARAWIAHFLSDRKFAVKVNGVLSDFFDVLSGVSQGSELGPKLLVLYTADIPGLFLSPCTMFADDIKLYNDTDNSFTLQEDLNKVLLWSKSWGLPLNKNKCVVFHIAKKILVRPITLTVYVYLPCWNTMIWV